MVGKALTWDPSQMITCHPKKIPKFLLKGGVVQFCPTRNELYLDISINMSYKQQNPSALVNFLQRHLKDRIEVGGV